MSTTEAYAFVPGLPPPFASVKSAYADYSPAWEPQRASFEDAVHEVVKDIPSKEDRPARLEEGLNTAEGFPWFRQRMFYRSSVAFYRCFQLFLAFLALDRRHFRTWAFVTGYYCRFYFIQALLNLLLTTWLGRERMAVVFDGSKVACVSQKELCKCSGRFDTRGSHEMWWSLMEALKCPDDYPVDEMGFVLSRYCFNPAERNNVNYSFEYLFGGFNELDWADNGAEQMVNHFRPMGRQDRDFTDVSRFFQDSDPEDADPGDFYGDTDLQLPWCSIVAYLRILKALDFEQSFVRSETLITLSEMHLARDYTRARAGIAQAIPAILDDNFDPSVVDRLRDQWRW